MVTKLLEHLDYRADIASYVTKFASLSLNFDLFCFRFVCVYLYFWQGSTKKADAQVCNFCQ